MRVVVVGASGNIGTAVLRRFAEDPVVTSVVGVARRVPRADGTSTVAFPHDRVEWVRCDLTDTADAVLTGLAAAFAGADAVVHLAWAIQPSHDRGYQKRVNVVGTRRVVDSVLRAGVPHLVVASSVGAYSPASGDEPVPETWPTGGVPGSAYSEDKAAVESLLDDVERDHPHLVVTRVRPALVFQQDAGSEVAGIFLGPLLTRLLRTRRDADPVLPALPLPRGLRLQVVHADDVAQAVRQVVVGRFPGPFNVAHPDVLSAQDLADLLAGGRLVEVPRGVARAAVAGAWRGRVAAVGEGWLDLALAVPVLDADRARSTLRWTPVHGARESVLGLVEGILERDGLPTPPLHPH